MTGREWKPGDVAMVNGRVCINKGNEREHGDPRAFPFQASPDLEIRPLVVIDPEDREQAGHIRVAMHKCFTAEQAQAALREFANPTPQEPTDPKARVTDRRENVWRLLADGDWVCTSGPDCGEYLVWSQLAERGPLTIEGVTA